MLSCRYRWPGPTATRRHIQALSTLHVPRVRYPQAAWVDIDFARDVVLERRLGSGAHGTVFAAWWVGRAVAVKVVALLEADGGGVCAHAVESIRQEVQVGAHALPARVWAPYGPAFSAIRRKGRALVGREADERDALVR